MKSKEVLAFIVNCLNQADADGSQQFEDNNSNVPDGTTPDDFYHDGTKTLWLEFGNELFECVIKKNRKKKDF